MKTALQYLVSAVIVAAVAWTGLYLFWHIRLVGAVRTLESKAGTPAAEDAVDVVDAAGCRALPYLIGALDHRKNQHFQILVAKHLFGSIEQLGGRGGLPDPSVVEKSKDWMITTEDSAAELQQKCDAILTYWRENGKLHHQSWRVWSSSCGP